MGQISKELMTNVHFIGIGGIGMGTLASLLIDQGVRVSGSDVKSNAMTALLIGKGARVTIGHRVENINGARVVIYSSAITENNPERLAAVQQGCAVLSRARLLAQLMENQCGITVAGAHGKTTTSSMIAHMLHAAGLEPTTAVGGMMNGSALNALLGAGKYFVSEVDESDGSFLYFHPTYSVMTNIDREHLDYYKTFDGLLKAYETFYDNTSPGGRNIVCLEDDRLKTIMSRSCRPVWSYGFDEACDVFAADIETTATGSRFTCLFQNDPLGDFEIFLPGRHNILNALAAIAVGRSLDIGYEEISESLSLFRGVKRRFQELSHIDGIRVIDDYAHHPTEIKATLAAARSVHTPRLIAVFQPHRYSRFKDLYRDFCSSLTNCDQLIVTDIYAASEEPIDCPTMEVFAGDVRKEKDLPVEVCRKEDIINCLSPMVRDGDMVLFLGAGDISQVAHDFAGRLNAGLNPKEAGT